MTNREFYTAILSNENLSAELRSFASEAILKLDKRNATRSSKPSKAQLANEPIKGSILAFLDGRTSALASEIGEACGITTAKASSLCSLLVKEGRVKAVKVKVPKVGERSSYSIITE